MSGNSSVQKLNSTGSKKSVSKANVDMEDEEIGIRRKSRAVIAEDSDDEPAAPTMSNKKRSFS